MRELIFFSSIGLAISSSSFAAAPARECAVKFSDTRARADAHFEKHRYLLAAVQYSGAALVACDVQARGEANLGYARSLALLGENEAAMSELRSLSMNASVSKKTRQAAQVTLAMTFDQVVVNAEPAVKDALGLWHARESMEAFQASLRTSNFSEAEKVKLADLRPKDILVKNPVLAGILSGVLPGAGQVYNGQYQTAAISFVLNGVFLLSTIQLAKKNLGFPAVMTGIAFSTVYFGNITSAVTGAQAINLNRRATESEELRRELTGLAGKL